MLILHLGDLESEHLLAGLTPDLALSSDKDHFRCLVIFPKKAFAFAGVATGRPETAPRQGYWPDFQTTGVSTPPKNRVSPQIK